MGGGQHVCTCRTGLTFCWQRPASRSVPGAGGARLPKCGALAVRGCPDFGWQRPTCPARGLRADPGDLWGSALPTWPGWPRPGILLGHPAPLHPSWRRLLSWKIRRAPQRAAPTQLLGPGTTLGGPDFLPFPSRRPRVSTCLHTWGATARIQLWVGLHPGLGHPLKRKSVVFNLSLRVFKMGVRAKRQIFLRKNSKPCQVERPL